MSSKRNEVVKAHYEQNFDHLCKQYSFRSGGPHDAEDVVQDAYKWALHYWHDDIKDFNKWFSVILNNSWKDYRAAERAKGMCIVNDEQLMEVAVDGERLNNKLLCREVVGMIGAEPPAIKEVLQLYFISGYTPRDISKVVDQNSSEIRKAVFNFKQKVGGLL